MITSRKDGILVLHTAKKYKMAGQGIITEQNEVVCKEITYPVEAIAFDIDQLFCNAMMAMASKTRPTAGDNVPEPVKDGYEDKDNPTESEIAEKAEELSLMFKMNDSSKMSELVGLFTGLVKAGFIEAFGAVKMTDKVIWPDIDRNDKLKIIFSYISFFIKPLASLEKSSTQITGSNMSGATAE